MMLPCFVMLDLETTGGNATRDRITEIAAVRIEHGVETARWSTLVNPECQIPPFIQSLTGITNEMVENAPTFASVANHLLALLDGAVFVAHNVRFDHGFVINELARLEKSLKAKTLCTVRLSRKLYPQHKSHGLDAIVLRHGLTTQARHRAMGDVDLVLRWLKIAATEIGDDTVRRAASELVLGSASVPPLLETPIGDIPDTPGVYVFYGEGPLPLYVGKSIHMRTRVLSHFQASAKVAREMRILTEIRRVEWHETAGELGALLLESRLVKQWQPLHNRQLRRERALCTWRLSESDQQRPSLTLVGLGDLESAGAGNLYGVYRSKRQATDALRLLCEVNALCPQTLGLEAGKGPCFSHQIGKCRGVCAGRESAALHLVRLKLALSAQRLQAWPFKGRIGIREHHTGTGRTDIHVFEQWCHLATVHDAEALHDLSDSRVSLAFDLDTYRMLVKRLSGQNARTQSLAVFPV